MRMKGERKSRREDIGKRKSLGDGFAKRWRTSAFLNCKLLSANYWAYGGWLSGRLWKGGDWFCWEVLMVIMSELAAKFCGGHEVLPCSWGEKFCWFGRSLLPRRPG